ncbi:MAG: hypothetical protein SGI98_08925 [Verrucomicrobiota bacterium]|nr:hypothetical protein [Verrucomicrobiota bacterium]
MKYLFTLLIAILMTTMTAWTAGDHHNVAGPSGGKILETNLGYIEFYVQPDRKIRMTLLDEQMKAVPAGALVVSASAETKTGKVALEFERSGDFIISKTALPEGNGYRIVLQIRKDASAKPQNLRIDFNSEICGGCKLAEYACICDHAGSGHSGH